MKGQNKQDSSFESQGSTPGFESSGQRAGATSNAGQGPGGEMAEPAPATKPSKSERKKRYYSPHEVMQKKGCIGCGGMALAVILAVAGIVAACVVFI